MIYLCQCCGTRINQRTADRSIYAPNESHKTDVSPENVGKHLLYKHRAFCQQSCIEEAKKHPHILNREVTPSNWFERNEHNPERPNNIQTWKTERKINRTKLNKNSCKA